MPGNLRTRRIIDRKHRIRPRKDGSLYVVVEVFQPRPNAEEGDRLELSTIGIDGMSDPDIWDLITEHFLPEGRSVKGRADVETEQFLAADLAFVPQMPPPRHGSFVDWPADETERDRIMASLASVAIPKPFA